MAHSQPPTPSFSLHERDRRWHLVRTLMESAGIEILVVTGEPDSRYLTQMAFDAGPTIFPFDGAVTAVSGDGRVGSAAVQWVEDVRPRGGRWTEAIVERLQELGADRKIVGVVGLDRTPHHPSGNLNYHTFIALREVFSHARWVGASELMQEARYTKSDEEIRCIEEAAMVVDKGLTAALTHVRPGTTDREIYGQIVLALSRAGGDRPSVSLLGVTSLNDPGDLPIEPIGREVGGGTYCAVDIETRCMGYQARAIQPIATGPLPRDWESAWNAIEEAWKRSQKVLQAGITLRQIAAESSISWGSHYTIRRELLGQGLGDDLPLLTAGMTDREIGDRTIQEGICFMLKLTVEWTEDHPKRLVWGETVAMTARGLRRLSDRPRRLVVN
jgi:Xaa-Pro aminopeptidase